MSIYIRRCVFFKKLLKAIVKLIVIIAVIILVVVSVVITAGGSLATIVAFGLSAGTLLAVGLGSLALAFMLDYDTAMETVGSVVKGVGGIVGAVVSEAGSVIGKGVSSIASGLGWLLPVGLIGFGVYWILSEDKPQEIKLQMEGDRNDY